MRCGVFGLGKTGWSVVQFLLQRGIEPILFDTRLEPPMLQIIQQHAPQLQKYCGQLQPSFFDAIDMLVLSPGISSNDALFQNLSSVEIIGDIELFARFQNADVLAITGTNGKSTVTSLVGHIASQHFSNVKIGGNLGIPALELYDSKAPDLYVLELSSFQLEMIDTLKIKVGTLLNFSPDHLDRYACLNDYLLAKQRIFNLAEKLIVNLDDANSAPLTSEVPRLTFSLVDKKADFHLINQDGQTFLSYQGNPFFNVADLKILGQHNIANALSACAMTFAYGIPLEKIAASLKTFEGLPHRCQFVAQKKGVEWYNDSKGTNTGATLATLQGLSSIHKSGKIILILGGQGKGENYEILLNPVLRFCKAVILLGEEAPKFLKIFESRIPLQVVDGMDTAVKAAANFAQAGDKVLLSPACASLDMFENYAHRGEVFTKEVLNYRDH